MAEDFSRKEKDRISQQLDKSLGQEYLSVRTGYGNTKLTYIEGWRIIKLANSIFGFDGWSSEIKCFTEEYNDDINQKINVGYSCVCRITLKNGIYKEDVGFGSAENQKSKGLAIEKAKKEASTDALKRALRQFGNALGNCCYDKQYVVDVFKLKKPSIKNLLNIKNLLSHKDFTSNDSQEISLSQEPDISDT